MGDGRWRCGCEIRKDTQTSESGGWYVEGKEVVEGESKMVISEGTEGKEGGRGGSRANDRGIPLGGKKTM